MLNPTQIAKWVDDFRIACPDALGPKKQGHRKTLNNSKQMLDISPNKSPLPSDTSTEHIKELRRLRLEEEVLLKKQRESSTVSEESSN